MREAHRNAVDRVSESRLWERHMHMARIGAIPGNGVDRAALSDEVARLSEGDWLSRNVGGALGRREVEEVGRTVVGGLRHRPDRLLPGR